MLYNCDFAIAGLVILIVLLIFIVSLYNQKMNTIILIRRVVISLILADAFDIITAVTISYPYSVPIWLNYILTILFFEFEVICISLFPKYIHAIINNQKNYLSDKINTVIVWIYAVICASSPVTHSIFYFDEERKYVHGYCYFLIFAVPLYFLIFSLVKMLKNRKAFNKRQLVTIIGFILCAIAGPILQVSLPGNRIIDYFALSVAAFVAVIGLETPDFLKLEKTLAELKESQEALQKAVDRAEAADRAKSDFLANMSHEIRTPINAVLGMNELISRESTESHILEYSSNVADAGNALLSLINDILDFSKIEAGKMEIIPSDYELSVLIREVNNIMSIRFANKKLDFKITNDENIPDNLYGDEVRIRQILINILSNALKYTDKGSVTLDIKYEQVNADNINLVFSIKDTGIGIKEEDLSTLFTAFTRIDLEHNRKKEGTGLGLSITHSFIELMDGNITVESKYGEGSIFTVSIPQKVLDAKKMGKFDLAKVSVQKEAYSASFTTENAKLLVVDDVLMNLEIIKGLLKENGLIVDAVESGKECLEKIANEKYDIILLDHMMPDLDGVETMKRMKEDLTHPNQDTPVIMLTANAITGAKEEYIKIGFSDYLSKPVQPAELDRVIVKHLPKDKVNF